MAIQKKELLIKGMPVLITENPGQPLLMLVRMASRQMGVWDKVWEPLSRYFTVANFDTTPADLDKFGSAVAIFHEYARQCVDVADGLGYKKFHIFGWSGGAQVAMRAIIDFPDVIQSCVMLGPSYVPAEARPYEKQTDFWTTILDKGDLELYTYWWLLQSYTPEYAESHFDEIERLVNLRVQVDKGRLDTKRIIRWLKWLRRQPATDEELEAVRVPTLIVAPTFTHLTPVRKLNGLIKTSQLAFVPGSGIFVPLEDPDAFMKATGQFLRAAAQGHPPIARLADSGTSTIIANGKRTDVVENASETAVVFLHGWLMSPEMWAHSMKALQGKVRNIALWQPGHGRSSSPDPGFTMDDWGKWLISALDRLNIRKVVLVGHSMGGMLSLHTAIQYPDRVNGLVLVDTQDDPWDKPHNDNWVNTVDTIAASWGPETARQAAALLMSQQFLDKYPAWLAEWTHEVGTYDLAGQRHVGRAIASRPDFSARAPEIKTPVLVVHSSGDKAIDISIARAMVERIPGAQLEEVAGVGHCPPLESPEVFTASLTAFLRRKGFIN